MHSHDDLSKFLACLAAPIKTFLERSVAGHHVARLYEDRASAESYLSHEDPKLRYSAILVIAHHWGLDDSLCAACERLLHDPDSAVCSCAVTYLAQCYYHTDDKRIGRAIAEIVYDNSQPQILRLAAYRSLFNLRRSAHSVVAKRRLPTTNGFRFPEDVDWTFVDTFLFGYKTNVPRRSDIDGLLFA